ncbi:uncharacterized protein [Argopecten irradians]|uniref:uncharacterized protein n=1 Tax=Argopecten irradians TaxID=31199 RepID=UPI0037179F70
MPPASKNSKKQPRKLKSAREPRRKRRRTDMVDQPESSGAQRDLATDPEVEPSQLVSLPVPTEDTPVSLESHLEQLTQTITASVTEAVLASLRRQGVYSKQTSAPPAAASGSSPATPGPSSSVTDAFQNPLPGQPRELLENRTELSGGLEDYCPVDTPPVSMSCRPLHAKVPSKLKERIWAGEFIDLGLLLDDQSVNDFSLKMNTDGHIGLVPSRRKVFLDIDKWTDAFNIFVSVLRLKFPSDMEALATYQNVIRNIANCGGNWYYYDTNFRKMKQSSPDMVWNV